MKNRVIIMFIIFLTLFLAISAVSANENNTDVISFDKNSTSGLLNNDFNSTNSSVNKSESVISASDIVTYNNLQSEFKVKLTSNETPLSNKQIIIFLNNINYTKTTDSEGIATLNFKLITGTYAVEYSFLGDENYTSANANSTITVKSDVVTYLKVVHKDYCEGIKSVFKIKLVDIDNKAISGKTIIIKVNGKKYSAKTDSKGYATFYLNLKKGLHKIEYSFSQSGKYLVSSGSYNVDVKSKLSKGNGYWVNKWDMKKVNLKKLFKCGTKHIFLQHTAFSKYGEKAVLKWIKKAHKYDMKVHIWMAVFYKNGKFVHASNKKGHFNYKHMNTIIKKAKHYASLNGVDGIHFDYVRFSGNAYKFKNSVEAVNYFVKTACIKIRNVKYDCIMSAAVMPEPSSMKHYYAQDISTFSKYFDVVIPMVYKGNYHSSSKWIKKITKVFVKKSNGAQVWSGLQSYKSDHNIKKVSYKTLFKDAKAAKNGGAKGIVIFRWGLSPLLNFKRF